VTASGAESVTVIPYDGNHREQVVALWRQVFPHDPPWNEPNAVIDAKLGVHPDLFFVACAGDQVAGTAMGGYDGHRGWVYAVAVSPERRRQGIAARLMQAVESALRAKGCVKLNLQVRSTNAAVVRFYEGLGYDVEDRISMGKRLI
jgi:ribosomal protein S18 acetylase RimI-like enzyme